MEQLRAEERQEELIAVCGIILDHDPRSGAVMVVQGSAYGALLQREFERNIRCRISSPNGCECAVTSCSSGTDH